MARRVTTEDFVRRAREKHADVFDYSQSVYTGYDSKLTIICRLHGPFEQSPSNHLCGTGCPDCAKEGRRATTESFKVAARAVHGDRYGYGLVEYASSKRKVTITCFIHGTFDQSPSDHVQGKGCPACSGHRRHTDETFADAAREVHGDRYGYELVEYTRVMDKVTIVCFEHGPFEQVANNHLNGHNCPGCAQSAPLTHDAFLARAAVIHGRLYDYSQVVISSSAGKVTIGCRIHGPFEQSASSHLSGAGCGACAGVRPHTCESFIAAARAKHGDRYGYDKVVYTTGKAKVTITCPKHGDFEQAAAGHLSGYGCAACAGTKRRTTAEFVAEARAVHGDRFSYDRTQYTNGKGLVTITCPEHGDFERSAASHLSGGGCLSCKGSGPEQTIRRLLQEAGIGFAEQFSYPTLRYKGRLRLDFIIPASRVAIEFDGPHHREPQPWHHKNYALALQTLEDIRQRDIAKSVWAISNRIRLVRLRDPETIAEDLRANGIFV